MRPRVCDLLGVARAGVGGREEGGGWFEVEGRVLGGIA